MAEAPEFEPRELDLLEDALEGLEDVDDLGELGLEPRITDRLGDYREILQLSREALTFEEVPAGLLDDVIAQAARGEASPVVVNAGAAASGEETSPWWQRWRRWMVPTLALAGSAAAVLWIVAPETEGDMIVSEGTRDETEEKSAAAEMGEDGRLGGVAPVESTARPTVPTADTKADASNRTAYAELAKEEDAAPLEEEAVDFDGMDKAAEQAADAKPGARPAPAKKAKSSKAKPSAASGGGAKGGYATDDPIADEVQGAADKDGVWELVEQGEKSLSSGNCTSAKRSFKKVIASKSADALALARAHAGIGVCLEWEGDVKQASGSFDQARLFQPGDAGNDLINSQRNRLPPPSEQKKSPKAKKKASKSDAFDL